MYKPEKLRKDRSFCKNIIEYKLWKDGTAKNLIFPLLLFKLNYFIK